MGKVGNGKIFSVHTLYLSRQRSRHRFLFLGVFYASLCVTLKVNVTREAFVCFLPSSIFVIALYRAEFV